MSARPIVDFDHHSAAYAADPAGAFAALRDRCPVAWSEAHGGFWVVSRYDDIARIVRDDETFSSRHDNLEPTGIGPFTGIVIPGSPNRSSFIEMDPPEFHAYRRLLNARFSPPAIERLRPLWVDLTNWCLDERIESGQMDLVLDLANPMPAMATLHFLGLPIETWEMYANPLHTFSHTPRDAPEFATAVEQMLAYLAQIRENVRDRLEHPRADLLTELTQAEVGGRRLDEDDIVELCSLILAGGIDTTTAVTGCALLYLDEHRDARRRLIDDPALMPSACEEFLRYYTPNQAMARTVTRDVELGGQTLHAGDRVIVAWQAANHDPAVFPDPEEIILERFPNRHMTFGLGLHRCIGSSFARAELEIMVTEVLRRLPDYTVDRAATTKYPSIGINNGYIRMPARFTPGPSGGSSLPETARA